MTDTRPYYLYTTVDRDMFDSIALDFYDDENLSHEVIAANPDYAGVIVFEPGVELRIPILEDTPSSLLPPWKRG